MAKMQIAPTDRAKVKVECLRLLATLRIDPAKSKLIGAFIDGYLKLTSQEMNQYEQEFALLQPDERELTMALVSSWEQKGIEQGIRQGIEQGIVRGRLEGERDLVQRLIIRRFGSAPEPVTEQLRDLSTAELAALGEAIIDFTTSADLDNWLAHHKQLAHN